MEVIRRARGTDDGMDAVKEAARAWYSHRSGLEQKPIREHCETALSPNPSPKPSHYKLEAMKMAKSEPDASEARRHDRGICKENSLLDSYEIDAICRQLDQFIEYCRHEKDGYSRARAHHHQHQKNKSNEGSKLGRKMKVLWQRHALMCWAPEDVVINSIALKTRRVSEASFTL
ncbi:hypothetical protein BT93_J0887 [Corymbia citriodora subsp. variegata]|nr:hypothetical protein BT93_J0887 [Corymbia citriodora subsp. variegata]